MKEAEKKLSRLLLCSSEQHRSIDCLPSLSQSSLKDGVLKGRVVLGRQRAPQTWEHNQRPQMAPPAEGSICIGTKNRARQGRDTVQGCRARGHGDPTGRLGGVVQVQLPCREHVPPGWR